MSAAPESPLVDEPTQQHEPLALALRLHADQTRTGQRLERIETDLGEIKTALAGLPAALRGIEETQRRANELSERVAELLSRQVAVQEERLTWDRGAPERARVTAQVGVELMKAGGALLLAAAAALGAAWAAFKGTP